MAVSFAVFAAATHSISYFNLLQLTTQTNTMLNVYGDGSAVWRSSGNALNVMDLDFERSRILAGAQADVVNGDVLRRFVFEALGANNLAASAGSASSAFRVVVDDPSPSATSMGGKYIFSTCSPGSTVLVDRVIIDNQVRTGMTTAAWRDFVSKLLRLFDIIIFILV